ncbi:MAG: hypothetical protein NTY00_02270 [Deltaproteobacteria bacterium]|nr:hypothetical protein [Deltaproteobacteria bacterium]
MVVTVHRSRKQFFLIWHQGFTENQFAARDGGTVAGDARRQLEAKSGKKVVTANNYLTDKPKHKLPPKSE